ncbi:DUF4083 domain-containing protein [Paenisporosarcina quisquiliarum]|uniref:DUF4083 domain-containing protein n=2 Tax=Paenisporosarcina quisquiliarum TaxID=365346 RepID=A0A9X3LIM7_9BACL|nr:DUF4083 family protein [Paenisporosarcina quisquiliarum]MCZ8537159.1 DUF4083 domain-containing protein [Paenisporosarcina quisquiliarum]
MGAWRMSFGLIMYMGVIIGLSVIFVLSFTFFIRRILINSTVKKTRLLEIDKKLDKIIDLLELNKSV